MNKRQAFYLLLGISLIAIGVIVWWLVAPLFQKTAPAVQPPPLPFTVPSGGPATSTSLPIQPVPVSPVTRDDGQLQDLVMQRATMFAATLGTYSSSEEFSSLHDLRVQATKDMQVYLASEQTRLRDLHPAYGPPWSQTTRALSSRITSTLPLGGKDQVEVSVQVQKIVETLQGSPQIEYQDIHVTLIKQGAVWNVASLRAQPLQR